MRIRNEPDSVKSESLSEDLRVLLRETEMLQEFARVLSRFKEDLYLKLCLKPSSEHFFNIPISAGKVRLGEIASIFVQSPSTNAQFSTQFLIDVSGRPELATAARTAVGKFLSRETDESSKRHSSSDASNLIQTVGPTQFSVQLPSVVTGTVREDLARQGRDMLHRTKKEMDKIFQNFSRPLTSPTLKSLSEDDKRLANLYLKGIVRAQHLLADEAWKMKEQELLLN